MAVTYEAIATVTVTSATTANIEFTSIPATYTDLALIISARSTRTDDSVDNLNITFNNSTTNYKARLLYVYNNTVGSAADLATDRFYGLAYATSNSTTSSTFCNSFIYIPNYAGSNYKSVSSDSVSENNSSTQYVLNIAAGLWSNTAAITSIKIDPNENDLMQYSSATLYGIKNS